MSWDLTLPELFFFCDTGIENEFCLAGMFPYVNWSHFLFICLLHNDVFFCCCWTHSSVPVCCCLSRTDTKQFVIDRFQSHEHLLLWLTPFVYVLCVREACCSGLLYCCHACCAHKYILLQELKEFVSLYLWVCVCVYLTCWYTWEDDVCDSVCLCVCVCVCKKHSSIHVCLYMYWCD